MFVFLWSILLNIVIGFCCIDFFRSGLKFLVCWLKFVNFKSFIFSYWLMKFLVSFLLCEFVSIWLICVLSIVNLVSCLWCVNFRSCLFGSEYYNKSERCVVNRYWLMVEEEFVFVFVVFVWCVLRGIYRNCGEVRIVVKILMIVFLKLLYLVFMILNSVSLWLIFVVVIGCC